MGRDRTISDEEIVSALITNTTRKEAAAVLGISERCLYDRTRENSFLALYKTARADVLRSTVFILNGQVNAAVETITAVMNDADVNPATRLQAAQTILNNALKYSEKLKEYDADATGQDDFNAFSI